MISGNPDLSALFARSLSDPAAAIALRQELDAVIVRAGSVKAAAAELKIGRRTLHRWLTHHGWRAA